MTNFGVWGNPKDLLLTLKIETCYRSAPSLYSEVYQMPDGTGRLYWLYELKSSRLLPLCRDFRVKYDLPQEMSITDIFKHSRFVEEYQKINFAKCISVPIEEMIVVYRIINEGLPDGQGNTIAELKNRLFARRPNHESIVYYAVLRILHRIWGKSGRVSQLEDRSPGRFINLCQQP